MICRALSHGKGGGVSAFVGNAQVHGAHAQPDAGVFPRPTQYHERSPGFPVGNGHVTQAQFRSDAGSQGLGDGFLGRETFGQKSGFILPFSVFTHFLVGKQTTREGIAMAFQGLLNPRDGDQIGSYSKDIFHGKLSAVSCEKRIIPGPLQRWNGFSTLLPRQSMKPPSSHRRAVMLIVQVSLEPFIHVIDVAYALADE